MEILDEAKNLAKEILDVKSVDDLKKIAEENHFESTKEELEDLFKKISSKELSDDELEAIAGGLWPFANKKAPELEKGKGKERFTSI